MNKRLFCRFLFSFPCSAKFSGAIYSGVFLPPATKLGQGYIFTGVCDSVHGGGVGITACIAGGIPACLAAGLQGEGGIPACLAGFQAHTLGGSRGVWPGGSRPTPKGEVAPGGCLVLGGGVGCGAHPLGQLLLQAVHILLDCILVNIVY